MSAWRAWGLAPLVVVLTVGCGAGKGGDEDEQARAPRRVQADGSIKLSNQDRTALGLTVAEIVEADLPDAAVRFGTVVVRPGDDALIISTVTGRIARAPAVTLGESVRAGALVTNVMPILDAPERISVGTQSAAREGEIEAARREVAKAEAECDRARSLSPQVVSVAAVQQAETAAAQARARLEALERARSVSSNVQADAIPVRAPMAGAIAALTVNIGASVKTGDVLGRIVRPGPVWVDVAVPPDEVPGDAYEIVSGARSFSARLLARGAVTETDGTRHDRIVVDDTQGHSTLVPGASVTVRVGHGTSRGVVVPDSAIVPGVDSDLVFIETSPSVFVPRQVRVAARFDGRVRLSAGLRAGDHVVVQGAMALYGERVRAQLQPS